MLRALTAPVSLCRGCVCIAVCMGSASVESRAYSHSAGPLKVGKKPTPLSSSLFVAWLWPCVSSCSAAYPLQQQQSLSEMRAPTSEVFVVLTRSVAALGGSGVGTALLQHMQCHLPSSQPGWQFDPQRSFNPRRLLLCCQQSFLSNEDECFLLTSIVLLAPPLFILLVCIIAAREDIETNKQHEPTQ